ncbi:MAG: alpha-amylase family glycosyl hydrolase [Bacteroidota bacterium]
MAQSSDKIFALIQDDPWLEPFSSQIEARYRRYASQLASIEQQYGSLRSFANVHHHLGFHYDQEKKGWWYREWAPRAKALSLIGDFNQWDRQATQMTRGDKGVWEVFVADQETQTSMSHQTEVKVHVEGDNGNLDRIPAYIRRAIQKAGSHDFVGQIWEPPHPFVWTDQAFQVDEIDSLLIYECHVGMALEEHKVGSWHEFATQILPRISRLGYTAIQLMAVHEHPYYGSFGYHVSNFFAPSSRFGTPEELKFLINEAHKVGIAVIMDVVHSHAVKNVAEGLNQFDGSEAQYFHAGPRGEHPDWDSKLFDYGKEEVQQFLLSNLTYWLEEFHFDGFRFDGVTSMLYFHHGNTVFDHYDKYFGDGIEWDAITYLQLANHLIHEIRPSAIVIAEDMSGIPGACIPIEDGGLGFDYRLGMGIPDYWIKLLKHSKDEEWNLHEIWHTLSNRRYKEKTIAYAESHDQGLVGDKTIAFRLMDQEMYWHMQVGDGHAVIERGIALHKLIRLLTATLGGEAYLSFIGNEFGHPEWIDFPREGNNWSYQHARRQWSLVDREDLTYKFLQQFDQEMIHLLKTFKILSSLPAQQIWLDEENLILIYERNNLIFVCGLHPTQSVPDYIFPVPQVGTYRVILDSDSPDMGGHGRVDPDSRYFSQTSKSQGPTLQIYIPSRTALVFEKEKDNE